MKGILYTILFCTSEIISNKKLNNCTSRKPPTTALLRRYLATDGVRRRPQTYDPQGSLPGSSP